MPSTVVNKANCFALWSKAQIAATNVHFVTDWNYSSNSTDTELKKFEDGLRLNIQPILANLALKGGLNAIRVFMPLGEYTRADGQIEHQITTIGKWVQANPQNPTGIFSDTSIYCGSPDGTAIPRFKAFADQLSNLLTLCADHGIGLILSVGSYYSADQQMLWQDANLQTYLSNFWLAVSKKWGQSAALIGYELLNEPIPARYDPARHVPGAPNISATYASMRTSLANGGSNFKGLMEQCIASIRVNDQRTPVVVTSIGGSCLAFDFFLDSASPPSRVNLFKDPGYNLLVYTCHFYAPRGFCNQGVYDSDYHALGTTYPNIQGSTEVVDPQGIKSTRFYDFANGGMTQAFDLVQQFRSKYGIPVFLGEFSASSTNYYAQLQDLTPEVGSGAFAYATPTGRARGIYGLFYVAKTDTAYVALSQPISLADLTEKDAAGVWRPVNRADIVITAANGQDIGPFKDLSVTGAVFSGTRHFQLADGSWHDEGEYLISFPWPANLPKPAQYLKYGNTDWHGAYIDGGGNLILQTQAFVDGDGKMLVPSGLRSAFESFPNGQTYYANQDTAHTNPQHAPTPILIGSFKIKLSAAKVAQQEAARVIFARDVLRQCFTIGMSWAWFYDYSFLDGILYGDQFWQVDRKAGKIRAVLKRAAFQSFE